MTLDQTIEAVVQLRMESHRWANVARGKRARHLRVANLMAATLEHLQRLRDLEQ